MLDGLSAVNFQTISDLYRSVGFDPFSPDPDPSQIDGPGGLGSSLEETGNIQPGVETHAFHSLGSLDQVFSVIENFRDFFIPLGGKECPGRMVVLLDQSGNDSDSLMEKKSFRFPHEKTRHSMVTVVRVDRQPVYPAFSSIVGHQYGTHQGRFMEGAQKKRPRIFHLGTKPCSILPASRSNREIGHGPEIEKCIEISRQKRSELEVHSRDLICFRI